MVKIIIGNPHNSNEIKDMMKVDMHSHTDVSDGRNTAEELIQKAKKMNILISITDHNEIKSSIKACREKIGIPGIEVTSRESIDILAYFYKAQDLEDYYTRYIKDYHFKNKGFNMRRLKWNMQELIEKTRKYACLLILPHPFSIGPKNSYKYTLKNKWLLDRLDGIEVINSIMYPTINSKAIEWAHELKKGATGGSDAHMIKFLGNTLTCSHAENFGEFLDNIRNKTNHVVGKSVSKLHKWHSNWVVFVKNLNW